MGETGKLIKKETGKRGDGEPEHKTIEPRGGE